MDKPNAEMQTVEIEIAGKNFEVRQPVMKQVIEVKRIFEKYDFDLMNTFVDVIVESETDEDGIPDKKQLRDNERFQKFAEKVMMTGMGPEIAKYALLEKGEKPQQSIPENKELIENYFLYDWSGGELLSGVVISFLFKMFLFVNNPEGVKPKGSSSNQVDTKHSKSAKKSKTTTSSELKMPDDLPTPPETMKN